MPPASVDYSWRGTSSMSCSTGEAGVAGCMARGRPSAKGELAIAHVLSQEQELTRRNAVPVTD